MTWLSQRGSTSDRPPFFFTESRLFFTMGNIETRLSSVWGSHSQCTIVEATISLHDDSLNSF